MKAYKRFWIAALAVMLVLSGCRSSAGDAPGAAPTGETETSQTVETTQPETTEQTDPETQPTEAAPLREWTVRETVLPEKDQATGTLIIYVNGKSIYAGGKVSDLIEAGIHTYDDLEAPVKPHEMSELIRVRVDIPNEDDEANEPLLFFVAMNPGSQTVPVSECLLYSLTVNCEKGVRFGSGKESVPFVTGETTREEIEAAYGTPTEVNSQSTIYAETVYYQPFSCVSFTFRYNVVRQIFTYYSANVFGDLAEQTPKEVMDDYFGADCFTLMSQYLDITDYLPGHELELKAGEDEDLHAQRKEDDLPEAGQTGVFKTLPEEITMNGETITLGCRAAELPQTWWKNFEGLMMPLERRYYMRVGRYAKEEFYFINDEGQDSNSYHPDELGVKGVITENRYYTNWGTDNSGFYEFSYDGWDQNATIDQIVEKYGQPSRLFCSSNGRFCFAWMHYDAENGNTLQLKVDPITNQLVELRVCKYIKNEMHF